MMKINKRMMGWVSVIAGILMFATSCHETLNVDPLDTTPPEITGFTPKVGQHYGYAFEGCDYHQDWWCGSECHPCEPYIGNGGDY